MANDEKHAAAQWTEAKSRLERVREDNQRAFEALGRVTSAAHQQAIAEEREAWRRLEYAAGRAAPQASAQCLTNEESPRV